MNTDKLLLVIDKIAESISEFTTLDKSDDEYYFEYPADTFWSVKRWHDSEENEMISSLYIYPKFKGELKELKSMSFGSPFGNDTDFISYNTKDIRDHRLKVKLDDLYLKIKSQYYGIDDLFDKILNK